MSNYVQTTFFAPKDALLTGNPLKLIKGADVDPEFAAIAAAIATKFDSTSVSSAPVGFADGTAAAPGITFASQTNMGFFRAGNNDLGIAVAGVKVVDLQAATITAFGSAVAGIAVLAITNTSTTAAQDVQQIWNAGSSQATFTVTNQNRATAVVVGGPTTAQAVLSTSGAIPLVFGVNGNYAGQIASTGAWTIPAATAAANLTLSAAAASQFALKVAGNAGAGVSFGAQITAGTNASDQAFAVLNQAATLTFLNIKGDGSGALGPSSSFGMQWATTGAVTILVPSSGNTFVATGLASASVFTANASATGPGVAFNSPIALTVGLEMGSSGTDFSKMQNDGANLWSIATNNAVATLGTPVFQWTNSGAPSLKGRGPTAAALVDMTPDKGTFTVTYTGFAANPTGTATWNRVGNLVTITLPTGTAVSNAVTMTATGIPAAINPALASGLISIANVEDNTSFTAGAIVQVNTNNTFTFGKITSSIGGFTASGTKGIGPSGITFSYMLNN